MIFWLIIIYVLIGLSYGGLLLSMIYHPNFWDKYTTQREIARRNEKRREFTDNCSSITIPLVFIYYSVFWLPILIWK